MDNQKIREFFNFNEADINENRSGRISQAQMEHQKAKSAIMQKNGRKLSVIPFIIAAAGVALSVLGATSAKGYDKEFFSAIRFGLVWGLLWGGMGVYLLKPSKILTERKLKSQSGRVRLTTSGNVQDGIEYQLHVSDHAFEVDENLSGYIVNGELVTVYYLDEIEEILSMEEMNDSRK